MSLLPRLFSYVWPVRVARITGRHGPLDLAWQNGRLVIDSAHANQSHGSLQEVWRRTLRMTRVGERHVERVLVLGLGGGGIVQLLRTDLGLAAPITAVDDDPAMVHLALNRFGLARIPHLDVITADAFDTIATLPHHFDLILVDLFHDDRVPEQLSAPATCGHLHARLSVGGLLLVNTMALDEAGRAQGQAVRDGLTAAGLSVRERVPLPGNRVWEAVKRRSPAALP